MSPLLLSTLNARDLKGKEQETRQPIVLGKVLLFQDCREPPSRKSF